MIERGEEGVAGLSVGIDRGETHLSTRETAVAAGARAVGAQRAGY